MEYYRHFSIASYMYAYTAAKADNGEIRRGIETYLHLPTPPISARR